MPCVSPRICPLFDLLDHSPFFVLPDVFEQFGLRCVFPEDELKKVVIAFLDLKHRQMRRIEHHSAASGTQLLYVPMFRIDAAFANAEEGK